MVGRFPLILLMKIVEKTFDTPNPTIPPTVPIVENMIMRPMVITISATNNSLLAVHSLYQHIAVYAPSMSAAINRFVPKVPSLY